MSIILTEVEVCMIRLALRAEALRRSILTDGGPARRDYYNLASKLEPFVKMEIRSP